jgi:two-component system KDP operon response regulator KdpE
MNVAQRVILIIDDDRSVRSCLGEFFARPGTQVVEAVRGSEALALVYSLKFDLVFLDIGLPGMGGCAVCREIRNSQPRVPILMLISRASDSGREEAFDAGADDYLTKPLHLKELAARLRGVIPEKNTLRQFESVWIRAGDIGLDWSRHLLLKSGSYVRLTPKECKILHHLMNHSNRTVPHAELLRHVWGNEYGEEVEYLRTFMRQLRKKIEDDPGNPKHLLTDPYIGYRFNADGATPPPG